jgi:ribonuclease VapC
MIVDTSALVAVLRREDQFDTLETALLSQPALIPAPVLVEFRRVSALAGNAPHPAAGAMLEELLSAQVTVEPFNARDADLAFAANEHFGTGNRRGGALNIVDLMVYAVAKRTSRPILCTGRDFASTDADIHPASRTW